MGNLGYKAIDVDNHYYEPLDAFTRHLDKKFRRRGVQMFSDGKHTQAVIGDRVNRLGVLTVATSEIGRAHV